MEAFMIIGGIIIFIIGVATGLYVSSQVNKRF
jgi:uncharacterized protein YneF (UPF0154 family)